MRQRNRYGIVLLLAAALAGKLPAQSTAPAGWATAAEPAAGKSEAAPVIASTRSSPPGFPPESQLPLPPDGLSAILPHSATSTARPPAPPPRPTPIVQGNVQSAVYVAKAESGNVDPGVVPAMAVIPKEEPKPVGDGSMLALRITGPTSSAPGQTLSCNLIARNVGTSVLSGVRVELPLPDGVRIVATEPAADAPAKAADKVGWTLGNLEVGAERLLKLDLMTREPGELHLCPTASYSIAVGLHTRIVRPPFSLMVSGPERANVGGPITWEIQVGNYTVTTLQRVNLTCKLSPGLGHRQGDTIETDVSDLPPGQVKTLKLEVQALQAGRQVISLSATADAGRTAQAQGIVMVEEMALVLTPLGPRSGRLGEELSYRLDVTNPGNVSCGPIRLTQSLPEGLEFLNASTGGLYNPTTQTITWALDGLPGQHRHEVDFKVRAHKGGDWALAAAVQAAGAPEVRATQAVHVAPAPSLTMQVSAQEDPLGLGAETTYEVRVLNQGPGRASGVRLRMILPDNLLAVQASAPTRWQIQGQQVLFDPIDQMHSRVAAVYRVRVRSVSPGTGRFHAELTAEGLAAPLIQELTCRVNQAPPPPRPLARAAAR